MSTESTTLPAAPVVARPARTAARPARVRRRGERGPLATVL
ncbi:hypothetical protein GA0115252_108515, partial [Streptomyces sp. DfronAA-171]